MGTNYYARIIPTAKRKSQLCHLINVSNDFHKIINEINLTYGSFEVSCGEPVGGEIHLGKRSSGWKFLWNPNWYKVLNGHLEWTDNGNGSRSGTWVEEPYSIYKVYDLNKESIKKFIDRKDVEIWDEYGEKQNKEEFWQMALSWITNSNGSESFDSLSYEAYEREENPRWKTYTCSGDYINMLKEQGIQFISETKSDFYSDGLRFATTTEFS